MFTEKELQYMSDTDFLLTKVEVSKKVRTLLNQTHDRLSQYLTAEEFTFPEGIQARAGKIARGENYQQLPYMLLDYPRKFTQDDVFALRTMFWWGHFFSVTFQLGGASWQRYRSAVIRNAGELPRSSVSLCVSDDPWQHYRDLSYYRPTREMDTTQLQDQLRQRDFLKLAVFLPLNQWSSLPDQALAFFQRMIQLIELP